MTAAETIGILGVSLCANAIVVLACLPFKSEVPLWLMIPVQAWAILNFMAFWAWLFLVMIGLLT